ncbi:MAG TPA: hypothetical protein VGW78_04030 [Candidatus Babeliales bacterium]|jgi:hypothetical protein|nr:hypothetical protein [Candidatus Babeliales bacterium]
MNKCLAFTYLYVFLVCTTIKAMENKANELSLSQEKMRVSFLINPHNVASTLCTSSVNPQIASVHQQARKIVKQQYQQDIHKADNTIFQMYKSNVIHAAPSPDQLDENQLKLVNLENKWIEPLVNGRDDAEAFLENMQELCEKGKSNSLIRFINNSAMQERKALLSNNPTLAEIEAYIPDSVKELLKKVKPAYSRSFLSSQLSRSCMQNNAQQRYARQIEEKNKLIGIQKSSHKKK